MKELNAKAIVESMNRQARVARNRWQGNINTVNRARKSAGLESMTPWTETVLATVLETYATRRALAETSVVTEATQASDVSFLRKHGINIITAAVPSLIANDLVSVQPLQARIGEIRYLDVKYGTTKGSIAAGTNMFSFDKIGGPAGKFDYSYDEVTDEAVVFNEAKTAFTLSWLPVVPGSVAYSVSGTKTLVDDGNGKLVNATTKAEAGTIDYKTGSCGLTAAAATATDSTITYQYDNITSPVEAPEVNLSIRAIPAQARSRKLKTVMSFDAMYDMQTQYGFDSNAENAALVANFLQYEIDGELIEDMYQQAGATAVTFSSTVPNAVSKLDHYEGFIEVLNKASNNIFLNTRFATGTWAVLGLDAATIVESLANRGFVASGQTGNGPHFIGTMGNFQMYKTPTLSNVAGFFIGYKGESLFHAGLVYAPYMPIMTTDLLAHENFDVKQGYATAYAKKMVNPMLYCKGTITA
jgi:hypothetical protein